MAVAGATTLNGAVTLGNATGDDIVMTGRLASHLVPKTNDTYDLGSTGQKWRDLHIAGNVNTIPVSTLATIGDVMALSIALG